MLTVENLRKRLGRFQLRVDALEIPAGCYFLLLGPSGSGKTVLLETLAGLNRPEQGAVRWAGTDITSDPPESRGVGFVYQKGWLFPHLSVRDNIRFGLSARSAGPVTADEQIRRLAERFGITHLLDRLPRKLSGGEGQRVAMARALATRPRLLFLDEPLGPLDPAARESLARELKAWHTEFGTTTIHVTHDHVEARLLADRIGIMFDGRLMQDGPPDEVFRRPGSERLARFVGCENIWTVAAEAEGDGSRLRLGPAEVSCRGVHRGSVTVCVRPEDVVPVDDGAAERHTAGVAAEASVRLAGTIREISDRGPVVRLTVEAGGLSVVLYETPADARRRGRRVGAAATIGFAPEAVHVLTRPAPGSPGPAPAEPAGAAT